MLWLVSQQDEKERGGPDSLVLSERKWTCIRPHIYYSYIALGTLCSIDLLNPKRGRQKALQKYRLVPCKEQKLAFIIHTDNIR